MNTVIDDLKSLILYKYCVLKKIPTKYGNPGFSAEVELKRVRATIQEKTEHLHKLHNTKEEDYFKCLTGSVNHNAHRAGLQDHLKEIEKQKDVIKNLESFLRQFPNDTHLLGNDLYEVVLKELQDRDEFHQRTLDRINESELDPNDLDALRKLFQEEIDKTNQDLKYLEEQLKQITSEISELKNFKNKLDQFNF